MNIKEITSKAKQHKALIVCAMTVIMVLAIALALASCSSTEQEAIEETPSPETTAAEKVTEQEESTESNPAEPESKEGSQADKASKETKQESSKTTSAGSSNTSSKEANSKATKDKTQSKPSSGKESASSPEKRWVKDTKRIWIVDKAAWTEEIPVYEEDERSICNVCGADITGNTSPHNKAHMMAGEGGGYHSEVHKAQVGTKKIKHAEEGHWVTKVIGGHWE